jgi:type IV pilus assembly protein PilC
MSQRSPYWQKRAKVPRNIVVSFYRELSTMLRSGVSMVDALQVTVNHSADDTMSLVAAHLQTRLDSGYCLSAAMAEFPRIFSPVALALVRLGESNGQVIEQLAQLSVWLERDEKLRRKVVSALTYPVFALVITGILTLALFLTVVPGFIEMFEDMKMELPLPTRVLAAVTHLITSPLAWAITSFTLLVLVMVSRSALESKVNQMAVYSILLHTPVIGPLLQSTAVARFAFAATAMLGSGSNIITGFKLSADTTGSPLIIADAKRMVQSLEEGRQLSEHMGDRPDIYPRICVQLTAVGEESARMPEMFGVMAEHYEEQIDHEIQILSSLMEPLLMSILAVVVGFIVMGVFLPMYSFVNQIG